MAARARTIETGRVRSLIGVNRWSSVLIALVLRHRERAAGDGQASAPILVAVGRDAETNRPVSAAGGSRGYRDPRIVALGGPRAAVAGRDGDRPRPGIPGERLARWVDRIGATGRLSHRERL